MPSAVIGAAVLTDRRTLEVRDIDMNACEIPDGGGWLTVDACGICGSDWATYAQRTVAEPVILGHEIVGTVTATWGALADRGDLGVGQRVLVEEFLSCLTCAACRSGRHRLCPQRQRYGSIGLRTAPGLWGGFADQVFLHPRAIVHRVPDELSAEAATLAIPLANGLSWVGGTGRLQAGDSVLILGPGQHGLACVAAATKLGARVVAAVGAAGDQARLDAASDLGATGTATADTDLESWGRDLTGGTGFDVIVDTTPGATETLALGVRMAAVGARLVIAGNKGGSASPLPTDEVFRRELSIHGVAARESWAIGTALAWMGAFPEIADAFAGDVVGLGGVEDALRRMGGETAGERSIHTVVVPSRG